MADKGGKVIEKFRDFVTRSPCTRDALLYGVTGGLVLGLAGFTYTKHIRKSCDIAVLSFVGISIGSWEYCRYKLQCEKEEIKKTIDIINEKQRTRAHQDKDKDEVTRA